MSIFFWKKQGSVAENTNYAPYEEISEKKTTTLGYFLLFIMVILGVWRGQGFITSVSDFIKSPEPISICGQYLNSKIADVSDTVTPVYSYPYYYSYYNNNLDSCVYSSIEKLNNIPLVMEQIIPLQKEEDDLQQKLNNLNNSLSSAGVDLQNAQGNYSVTLTEKIANVPPSIDGNATKNNFILTSNQLDSLKKERDQVISSIKEIDDKIVKIAKDNSGEIKATFAEFDRETRVVDFERALLLFLLITPALYFCLRKYLALKKENSQYTIIWTAVSLIFAILFAQVSFQFVYQLIPREFITFIINIIHSFRFLLPLSYYALLLLVPILFGWIVYVIQKRVYNKKAVMIRALKNHKCPDCSMLLRNEDRFCPVCHFQIKETCSKCNGQRIVGLAFCPICGEKK